MAGPTSDDAFTMVINFDTDTKKAMREIDLLTKGISQGMRRNQKAAQDMGKGIGQVWKMFANSKEAINNLRQLSAQLQRLDDDLADINKRRQKYNEMLADAAAAPKDSEKQQRLLSAAEEFGKAQRVTNKEFEATVGALEDSQRRVKDTMVSIADTFDVDFEDIGEALAKPLQTIVSGTKWEDIGENIASPFSDLLSRDAPTLMKRVGKIIGGPGWLRKPMNNFADRMLQAGGDRMRNAKLGVKGMKGSAGLGALQKALGGLVKGLTMLGPVITGMAGLFGGLIKILLDAEAAGKEYNRQLLETTSTTEFLARNQGDAVAATRDLQDSLAAARDAAHSFALMQMGISKEVARSFQAAITAEGVALDDLGRATKDATVKTAEHARTIMMGVAYARQFGVSISEIANLQGQMMSELGMNSAQAQESFQRIADGATDAGMQANKFFQIVRGFSSDLSLFTLRLEDVTKIMGALGKTMDPRKMSQFLQQLNQSFGGGIEEGIRLQILADKGGGNKVLRDDLAVKFDNLGRDIRAAFGDGAEDALAELTQLIKKNDPREIAAWKHKHDSRLNQNLNEEIDRLVTQNERIEAGDKVGTASIVHALSPFAKYEYKQAMSRGQFDGKRLEELSGRQLLAAEKFGIATAEEIQGMKQMRQGFLIAQEGLLKRMEDNKLTAADKLQLDRLGVDKSKRSGKTAADAVRAALDSVKGDSLWYKSLDKSQRELVDKTLKTRNFAEESADLQTSMNDKLQMITDILMNYIFSALEWIGKLFQNSVLGKSRDLGAEKLRANAIVSDAKDSQLMKSWQSGGDDISKARAAAVHENAGRALKGLQAVSDEASSIRERLASGTVGKDEASALEKRLKELQPALELAKKYGTDVGAFKKLLDDTAKSEALGGVPKAMEILVEALNAGRSKGGAAAVTQAAPAAAPAQEDERLWGTVKGAVKSFLGLGPATPAKSAGTAEATEQQKATVEAVNQVQRTVANDGVKIKQATIAGPLKDSMAQSVYDGTSKALFEYYMYSALDRGQVVGKMQAGLTPAGVTGTVMAGAQRGLTPAQALAGAVVQPNALGGTVTGVVDGMASIVRPAPGEGWASVGPGETIVPAGAGGGGGAMRVQLELKGDLRRFIDARVVEGTAAHDRNRRLR